MVPFPTIPPSESFGWKDFFDSLAFPWGKVPPKGADEGNATDNHTVST